MADTIAALEAHLEHAPTDFDAYVRLKRLLQAEQDHARIAALVEARADRVAESEAAQLYHEAARIVSYYLRDDDRTVALLARALERDPLHEESVEDLERMLEVTGDVRRHTAVLERRAKRLVDVGAPVAEISHVYQRVGELYEHDLGRSDKALASYRLAYEHDKENVAAIYAAREIHRLSGNLPAAATLLEMEAAAEQDHERKKALLLELAHLAQEALRDEDRAVKALGESVALDARDVDTLHAYALALHRRASTRPGTPASTRDLEEMADVLVKLSALVDEQTAMTFLESALDAAPMHEGALDELERLCERFSATDRLGVRWVNFLSAGGQGPNEARRRHALADAYVAAERPEDAIVCLEPLLERGDAATAPRLVTLYRQVGRTEGLAKAMRISVSGEQDLTGPARMETLRELLRVAREARDTQETRRVAEELLAIDPNDQPAFDVLVLTLASKADHASLLALHRRLGTDERVRTERRLEAWRAAASVAKERLHDDDAAIDAWRAIAALAPDDVLARRALRDRLRAADRHGELADALAQAAEGKDEDRAALLGELLELAVQPEVAVSLLDRAAIHGVENGVRTLVVLDRAIDAGERARRFADVVEWLEARYEVLDDPAEKAASLLRALRIADAKVDDPKTALRLADLRAALVPHDLALVTDLVRIARNAEEPARVLDLLVARAALVPEGEAASVLREAARVADESLDDPEKALALYREALERAPSDLEVEDAVRGLFARTGRHADLVAFLEARAARDPSRAVLLLREAARTTETAELPREARVHALESLLAQTYDQEALDALLGLLRAEGPPESLVKHLATAVAHAAGEDEQTSHAMERVTVLADVLGDDARALEALDALHAMAPTFAPALGKMATIHERRGDHEALTRTLRAQLAVARGPSQRLETARRILALHEGERPDPEAALEALRAWRLAAPDDASPVARMVPLLEAAEAHAEALEALDALLALAPEDEERDARRRRAAMLAVDHLGDPEGAITRLLAGAVEGDPLAEPELRRIAEQHALPRPLAKALDAIGRVVDAPPDAQRRLLEAAEIYETQVNDLALALESTIGAYELGLSATHLIPRIASLAARASGYERLYAFHLRRAEDAGAPGEQIDALLDALAVASEHLEGLQAKRALLRALDVAGDQATAVARVEKAAAESDEKRPAFGLVRAIIQDLDTRAQSSSDDVKRALSLRAARLLIHGAKRPRDAYDRLVEATEADADPGLHAALVEAAVASGATSALDELLDKRIEEALDASVARAAMAARGALFEQMGKHSDAADLYQRLSGRSPDDIGLRDAHRRALARAGRNEDLLFVLDGAFRRAKTQEEKVAVARERARLWEGALANRYEAADAWKKVLALAPDDGEALSALVRLSPKTRVGTDELGDAPELENLPPRPSRMPGARTSVPPQSGASALPSSSTSLPLPSRESAPPAPAPAIESSKPAPSEELAMTTPGTEQAPEDIHAEGAVPAFEAASASEHVEGVSETRAHEALSGDVELEEDNAETTYPEAPTAVEPEAPSASRAIGDTISVTQALAAPRVPQIDLEESLLDAPIEDDFDRPAPRSGLVTSVSQELVDALDQEITDDDDFAEEAHEDASAFVEDASAFVESVEEEIEEELDEDSLELAEDEPPSASVIRPSLPPPPPPKKR